MGGGCHHAWSALVGCCLLFFCGHVPTLVLWRGRANECGFLLSVFGFFVLIHLCVCVTEETGQHGRLRMEVLCPEAPAFSDTMWDVRMRRRALPCVTVSSLYVGTFLCDALDDLCSMAQNQRPHAAPPTGELGNFFF